MHELLMRLTYDSLVIILLMRHTGKIGEPLSSSARILLQEWVAGCVRPLVMDFTIDCDLQIGRVNPTALDTASIPSHGPQACGASCCEVIVDR